MDELIGQEFFTLFVVVAFGIILGRLKIKAFSLDIAGVLIVSLVFGHFGFIISDSFLKFGLLLFLFTIGLQTGPGFIASFNANGKQLTLLSAFFILVAGISITVLAKVFDLDKNLAIGLFTGSLTSTPGLAIALESTKSDITAVGYGVAYPFGIIFIVLLLYMLPAVFRVSMKAEDLKYLEKFKRDHPRLKLQNIRIENENIHGKTIGQMNIRRTMGVTISKIQRNGTTIYPNDETKLEKGDVLRVAGTKEDIQAAVIYFGKVAHGNVFQRRIDLHWVLITNKKVINKRYHEVNLPALYDANIMKIRRNGVEIKPNENSQFKYGDKVLIACDRDILKKISSFLGESARKINEADFLPVFLGILVGMFLGQIRISLSDDITIKLGITGGALISGILFGSLGKTGPILWTLSGWANHLIRKLGLLIFIASVGTTAGNGLVETMKELGWILLPVIFLTQAFPIFLSTWFGYKVLKINFVMLLGGLIGTLTSSAGLGTINSQVESNAASLAYATVFPFAMVLIIVLTQVLAFVL